MERKRKKERKTSRGFMLRISCLPVELKGAACPDSEGGPMGENVSLP